jgi:hypothetical protein
MHMIVIILLLFLLLLYAFSVQTRSLNQVKIGLKLESKDPLLVTALTLESAYPCDICMPRNQLFIITLLGKSC